MATPASDDLRELALELEHAADAGETRELVDLRERFPDVQTAALTAMLDTLRENGKAIEVAPGEWRGPLTDEGVDLDAGPDPDANGRVQVRVSEEEPEPEPERDTGWVPLYPRAINSAPTVRLTMAIAGALDENALGQLIKAGIAEAWEAKRAFVLEVLP